MRRTSPSSAATEGAGPTDVGFADCGETWETTFAAIAAGVSFGADGATGYMACFETGRVVAFMADSVALAAGPGSVTAPIAADSVEIRRLAENAFSSHGRFRVVRKESDSRFVFRFAVGEYSKDRGAT